MANAAPFFDGAGTVVTVLDGVQSGADVVLRPDGRIVIAGGSGGDFALARYGADGALDVTFGGGDGVVTTDIGGAERVAGLALRTDGRLVAVGTSAGDFAVARYNSDGSLDMTFGGGDGVVTTDLGDLEAARDVALQTDGKIVVVGQSFASHDTTLDFTAIRYNVDGSLDTSFSGDGVATADI
ncbi:MAG: calcium-binding protein, partial [Alphaproteobacteria bacterium]